MFLFEHNNFIIPKILRGVFQSLIFISVVYPRILYFPVFGVGVSIYTLSTIFTLLAAIMALLSVRKLKQSWFRGVVKCKWIVIWIVAFLFWQCCSDITGRYAAESFSITIRNALYTTSHFLIATVFFVDPRCRIGALFQFMFGTIIVMFVGAIEAAFGQSIYVIFGIPLSDLGDRAVVFDLTQGIIRDGVHRCQSVFLHPIVYGQFIGAVIPIIISYIKVYKKNILKPALIAVLVLSPAAMWTSGSRSPLFVALASIALYWGIGWLNTKGNHKFRWASIGAFLIAVGTLTYFSDEIVNLVQGRTATEISSNQSRSTQLALGIKALENNPLFGLGDGLAPSVAGLVGGGVLTIDNLYLSTAVDFGYGGVICFIGFLGATLIGGIKSGANNQYIRGQTAMAFGLMVGFLVLSINANLTYIFWAAGLIVGANCDVGHNDIKKGGQLCPSGGAFP